MPDGSGVFIFGILTDTDFMAKNNSGSGVKKPSLKGMANTGYLGHFAQDKFIQQGHNDDGEIEYLKKSSKIQAGNENRKGLSEGRDHYMKKDDGDYHAELGNKGAAIYAEEYEKRLRKADPAPTRTDWAGKIKSRMKRIHSSKE